MSVFIRAFLDCMRPFKVSLPFGWPGESGADIRSFTIARSYPGYGRAPPETKHGHPSSQAYSPAIRLNAEIRRHQHTIQDNDYGVYGMTKGGRKSALSESAGARSTQGLDKSPRASQASPGLS